MSKARDFADQINTLITIAETPYSNFEKDINYSSSTPNSPVQGDLWVDTTDAEAPILKVYNGSTWIEMSGAGGGGGLSSTMMNMGA